MNKVTAENVAQKKINEKQLEENTALRTLISEIFTKNT